MAVAVLVGASWASSPVSTMADPERRYQVLRWKEDWSWVGAEAPATSDPFDSVKNVDLGGDWWLDFGGSFRIRPEWDENRTLGASPVDEDPLQRFRAFAHLAIGNAGIFRWFAEARYSDTWSAERPVSPLFRDDPDLQNFFLELTAGSETTHPVSVRVGRQELLFGAQRLVSPLDWSNTRRTFDGITVTARTPRTETVVFGTYPVRHEVHDLDSPIDDQLFAGVHSAFRPGKGHSFEAYAYLRDDSREIFVGEDGELGDSERWTFGGRWLFTRSGWKADLEAALQAGDRAGDDVEAFMGSATVGYQWADAAWRPAVELGLDVATGDSDPTDGELETFDHLFPLGHAYFGHLDLVGRQNVEAARLQLGLFPAPGVKWITALHRFELQEAADALYNAGGAPIRVDPTGKSGTEVATELDVLVSWNFATHHWLSAEVVRWWSDDFIEETGSGRDSWFAWLAYEFKF